MTGREKCSRLAEQFKRDAFGLAEQGDTDGALTALENHMQLLAISMLRDERVCNEVYDTILAATPQLIPS